MRTMIAAALACAAAGSLAAAPACTDSYEGRYIPHWEDPDRFFLTCWPVVATPSTVWRDANNQPFDPATLDFEDVLTATGCFDVDGFTLVAEEVVLQAPAATTASSDVQAVLGVGSGPAWIVQTTTDTQFALPGIPNMPITLQIGRRYTITNASAGHPFQLVAGDNALGNDTVVLSQGATAGSMEGDAGVAWIDNGNDITFTATSALATALEGTIAQQPTYRCGVHVASMRAGVSVVAASAVSDWQTYE